MIKVTFADGTSDMRPEWSPCIQSFGSDAGDLPRAPHLAAYADIGGLCIDGRSIREISTVRFPLVFGRFHWRITGQDTTTKALTGEWQEGHVESHDEQVVRLTSERDAALVRAATLYRKMHAISKYADDKGTRLAAGDACSADDKARPS